MVDFQAKKEAFIKATPEALFNIVTDFAKHNELAGSGEIVTIRQVTDGPVGFGTTVEATEKLPVGDQVMDAVARSVVVTHEPSNTISWISSPIGMPIRRIQWWFHFDNFHLTPQGEGTNVVHEVEARQTLDDRVRHFVHVARSGLRAQPAAGFGRREPDVIAVQTIAVGVGTEVAVDGVENEPLPRIARLPTSAGQFPPVGQRPIFGRRAPPRREPLLHRCEDGLHRTANPRRHFGLAALCRHNMDNSLVC